MSQNKVDYSLNPTGIELMDDFLANSQSNFLTKNSGITRPEYARAGTDWVDTSVTPWLLKIYDGVDDVIMGKIDPTTHKFIVDTPLTTKGDLLVQGDNKPQVLSANITGTVLTSNGPGEIPSYQKSPIGILEYSSTRTYQTGDYTIANDVIYKSKIVDNIGNPVTDEESWERVNFGVVSWGNITGTLTNQTDLMNYLDNLSSIIYSPDGRPTDPVAGKYYAVSE